MSDSNVDDSGFTVYPAPALAEERWSRVRAILETAAWESSSKQALCKLRFVDAPKVGQDWIETVKAAAKDYRERPQSNFHTNIFLFVDETSVQSILAAHNAGDISRRRSPPYVFAVDQALGTGEGHIEPQSSYHGWFKVHLLGLGEVFRCVNDDALAPMELGGDVKENEVFMFIDEKVLE